MVTNIARNWKTTVLAVVLAIIGVVQASKVGFVQAFTDPLTQVSLAAAVAAALAKDADQTGVAASAPTPQDPPKS